MYNMEGSMIDLSIVNNNKQYGYAQHGTWYTIIHKWYNDVQFYSSHNIHNIIKHHSRSPSPTNVIIHVRPHLRMLSLIFSLTYECYHSCSSPPSIHYGRYNITTMFNAWIYFTTTPSMNLISTYIIMTRSHDSTIYRIQVIIF